MKALLAILSLPVLVGCNREGSDGPLPDVQRAGEIALETGSAAAFLKLYPGSTPEGSPDECEERIGRGERCGGAHHIDVTLTHQPENGEPVQLLVEIGPRGKVLHIDPMPGVLTNPTKCEKDEDCVCARCTGCVNKVHLPATLTKEADGCRDNRCASAGCRCGGGTCRTR